MCDSLKSVFFAYKYKGLIKLKVMKRFLLLLWFIVLAADVSAAGTIVKGRAVEKENGKALEYASVVAYDGRRRVAAACASDENGEFRLTLMTGLPYRICVSFIGFKDKVVEVRCKGEEMDLGTVALQVGKESIQGAGITAKPILKKEFDRIIYDVQADPDSRKMNMDAFMAKIPGLVQSERHGNLEYKGIELQSILVDDDVHFMINQKRQYPMSFIKAAFMSEIELILPGSPEYRNDKPILHIRLKEKLPYGVAGQLSGSASSLNTYSASPDFVLNTPVMGVGVNYTYDWGRRPELTDRTYRELYSDNGSLADRLESESSRQGTSSGHKISLDLNRKFLSEKLEVNVSMDTQREESGSETLVKVLTTQADGTENRSESRTETYAVLPFRFNGGVSAAYEIKDGWKLSAKYTFRNSYGHSERVLNDGASSFADVSDNERQEHNALVAFRFRNARKATNRRYGNIRTGYMHRIYDGIDSYGRTSTSGGMEYTQGIAYVSGMMSQSMLKNRYSVGLSLNIENIWNRGVDLRNGKSLDYNDFNIVPSLDFGGLLAKNQFFNVGYSMITKRPDMNKLNPYMDNTNPYDITVGNPELKGETTHGFTAAYTFYTPLKWWKTLELSGRWSLTPDAIESLSTVDRQNITTTTFANIGRRDVLGIGLRASFNPVKILTINLSADARRYSYSISQDGSNAFWAFNARQDLNLKLKWFTVSQDFALTPYGLSAQSKNLRMNPVLNLSISKYWSKIHLGGSLQANDLLHGRSDNIATTFGTGFLQHLYRQRFGRNVSIRIYWRFGAFKQPSAVQHESYDM